MSDDDMPDSIKQPATGEIVHFNPWRDFNDAPAQVDVFGDEPDPEQIAQFMDVVFGYCEGLIPVRSFIDKGQGFDGRPHNIWIDADHTVADKMATFANWASHEGAAVYVIPGTVAAKGQAKAADILQMQTVVVDIDTGDIAARRAHLERHLGTPTMVVESGGVTPEGQHKAHVWWKLTEPAEGEDIARICRLRGDIAAKVGGDTHFRSAHQPIRVAGSVYYKNGLKTRVQIVELNATIERDLEEFIEAVTDMPPAPGISLQPDFSTPGKPAVADVLVTPVREGAQDDWSRFEGASAAIGHYIRMVHDGRLSKDEGWQAICEYNAAMLRPAWPVERLKRESERLWAIHVEKHGPPLIRLDSAAPAPNELPTFTLGALLDDTSPMPADIIAPRVLTPGGLLVLGGAPKVGKSDLLITWLVHMAAGVPFLGFTPPRPLRIFYLQAEIQYHYLRERVQQIGLPPDMLAAAHDNLVTTPKLQMLLDAEGSVRVAAAIRRAFPVEPVDIICIDPIRNIFDGGPDGGGENDNAAMMFFLKERVEVLRDHINPDCGVILVHHTKKLSKHQVKDDPFLALSGASALRGFYTTGLILHRPDEEISQRRLEIELRNGPALPAKLVDKVGGRWVEINPMNERLVRAEVGARHDAERVRKGDVILQLLFDEAENGHLYTALQFAEAFENKAGLGGKPTPQPLSWRGWKTRPWIRLLSGTTLEPSTAARGVERWTSSLRAIRASRSRLRANAGVPTIRATSGRMSPASSVRSSRPSSSSRMSPIISASASPKSPADWSVWATGLRQGCLRRRKLARPTGASGCSSSPSAKETSWPTPRACSGTRSSGGNRTEMLQLWPTPQIDSFRSRGGERKDEKGLDRMARDWPTPMANDGCKPSAGNRRTADLTHAAGMWMTPTARDHKDGATSLINTPVNGLLGRQVLVTPMAGSDTCDARRTLNPLFVEALMGWPTGWTGFGSVATAWCHWLRRMRCELWRLNCWPMEQVLNDKMGNP